MDAKRLILDETLRSEFDMGRFVRFIKEFFNEAEIISPDKENEKVWAEYKFYVNSYTHVAKYMDENKNNILILAIKLQKGRAVDKARSLQRNFISKLISDTKYDAAIVAFYSDEEPTWRLSFVRLDVEFIAGKVKTTLTPAKRYSYLVGKGEPTHTAQERLYPIFRIENFNPTLDAIEEAFSVEAVTKDFFEKYKEKYFQLKEYLDSNKVFLEEAERCQFTSEQFAKKLMGQLAFLYFLQKKGWLGVKVVPHSLTEKEYKNVFYCSKAAREVIPQVYHRIGTDEYRLRTSVITSKEFSDEDADILAGCFKAEPWGSGTRTFIRDLFISCQKVKERNFFDEYLEPLFYQALNHKRGENSYYRMFNCKIPFLNGGLFDALENYNWKSNKFEIPNELFSNESVKGKDEADGILDIFDRYNFTMNEDEPLEKEVAVDPEMLGKIFENLLDVKDRKSKGAFYTPREIVHYMCQESLINYLVNKVDVPNEDMKSFILYGELMKDEDCSAAGRKGEIEQRIPKSVYEKLYQIDKALQNVKIADPAVGSGAFPLGMLNEIVKARNNITEYFVNQIPEDKKYERLMFRRTRHPYKIKWETIRNCIFAVDIENSAVDIAKLRLWLSIVVEQEIDEENLYPHVLPNLDCNIMCGNSLIDEFEGIKLFDESLLTRKEHSALNEGAVWQLSLFEDQIKTMTDELFSEQDRLFGEDDPLKKQEIKKNIDKLIDNIIRIKLSRDNNKEGIIKYEDTLKKKTKPYFLWHLEFGKIFKENGGFDIVIGNPPYVGQSGNKDIFRDIKETSFGSKFHQRRMDLFYFFYHKGIDIIKQKGVLSFITTNYFIDATNADILRDDLKKRTTILRIINFNELKIFESALGQHNMIMFLEKMYNEKSEVYVSNTKRQGFANKQLLNDILYGKDELTIYNNFPYTELFDASNNCIRIHDKVDAVKSIVKKLELLPVKLIDCCNINQGIVTGCNKISKKHIEQYSEDWGLNEGIYILSESEIESLHLNENEYRLLKPWFKNSHIHKWNTELKTDERVIYYSSKRQYTNVENIKKHLERFKIILVNRNVRTGSVTLDEYNRFVSGEYDISYVMIASEMKKGNYYCLSYARDEDMFTQEKIVVPQRSKSNTFGYNNIPWYAATDVYFINPKDKKISLKYVLGILNSKLYYLWLYTRGKRKGEILELFLKPISEIPLLIPSDIQQKEIVDIVDKILEIKNDESSAKKNIEEYETLLNNKIYSLYQLTDDEVKVIEKNYKGC